MLNLILTILKLYTYTPSNVNKSIRKKEYLLLYTGLRWRSVQQRRIILEGLKELAISKNYLIEQLFRIAEKDFITNAEMAFNILERQTFTTKSSQSKLNQIRTEVSKRIVGSNNKKAVYDSYKPVVKGEMFDKSKMQRLETVRKQLRKPMWR